MSTVYVCAHEPTILARLGVEPSDSTTPDDLTLVCDAWVRDTESAATRLGLTVELDDSASRWSRCGFHATHASTLRRSGRVDVFSSTNGLIASVGLTDESAEELIGFLARRLIGDLSYTRA